MRILFLSFLCLSLSAQTMSERIAFNLIKESEGFSATPYLCPAGYKTIGYGFRCNDPIVRKLTVISKEKADKILQQRIYITRCIIRTEIDQKINLSKYQEAALISFVYNVGEGNFRNSTLLKKINRGDFQSAQKEFKRWVYGIDPVTKKKIILPGLEKRRAQEANYFSIQSSYKKEQK